jgi:hypothetical protein
LEEPCPLRAWPQVPPYSGQYFVSRKKMLSSLRHSQKRWGDVKRAAFAIDEGISKDLILLITTNLLLSSGGRVGGVEK